MYRRNYLSLLLTSSVLLASAGCPDGGGTVDQGGQPDLLVIDLRPPPDQSTPPDLTPPADLSAADMIGADLTPPPDLTPPDDLTPLPDLTPPDDLTPLPDLTPPDDLTPPPDLTPPDDLTPPPDLTPLADLTVPPDLTPPDDLTPPPDLSVPPDLTPPGPDVSAEIQAVRNAADGTIDLPISGAVVTALRPAVTGAADQPGFFIQAALTGPAIFVLVDPVTLNPAPVVGDTVSFSATQVGTAGSVRQIMAITNFTRVSTGANVTALVQDANSAADLVSALGSYESELLTMNGLITAAAAASGNGYSQLTFNTAGITGNGNLRLRIPTELRDTFDFVPNCTFTLVSGPMWRFNATAQPSAWSINDFSVLDCPSPRVAGAVATSLTSVAVTLDRTVFLPSLSTLDFTLSGGLIVMAVQPNPNNSRSVILTTSLQTAGQAYDVTVASTVTDTLGKSVDAGANTAMFTGFVQPATVILNEVNQNISGGDLVELLVTSAGSLNGIRIEQDYAPTTPTLLTTLPNVSVQTGDLVVVHLLTPPAGVITETTGVGECTDSACYPNAWDVRTTTANGLTNSRRVVVVRAPDSSVLDAVPFVTATRAAFEGEVQMLQAQGLWLPPNCSGAPCTDTSTPTLAQISASWSGVGTNPAGNSAHRLNGAYTRTASDWTIAAPTWGSPNP